jgi:hypothetical protein
VSAATLLTATVEQRALGDHIVIGITTGPKAACGKSGRIADGST